MNRKFLRTARPLLVVMLLVGFASMAKASTFNTSHWTKGFETCNWKGAYVTANKGGDGRLSDAFDGIYGSGNGKIGSSGVYPLIVELAFQSPQTFTTYEFHTVDWDSGATDRSPKAWRVEASNDATNWTELDYHDDGDTYFTHKYQKVEFTFENAQAYTYYRISFLSCIKGTLFGLQEIIFPEYMPAAPQFVDPKVDLTIVDNMCYLEKELISATTSSIKITSSVYSDASLTELGVVYSTTNSLSSLADGTVVKGVYSKNPLFVTEITGLSANTTYYVRPYATNAQGTSFGEVYAITTASADATTISSVSPAIDADRALLKVTIPAEFTGTIAERGVVWNSAGAPTVEAEGRYIDAQTTTGEFIATVSGLEPRVCYHVRPYVKVGEEVHYGNESTFYSLPLAEYKWKEGAVVTAGLTSDMYRWCNLIDHAFDGKTGTRYSGRSQSALLFTFEEAHKLNNYKMGNADDATRYPKNWVIKASNDKATWTTLHSVNDNVWANALSIMEFTFENSNYYKYYVLDVLANGGNASSLDITEFDFMDFPNPDTGSSVDSSAEASSVRSYVDAGNRVVVTNAQSEVVQVVIYNSVGQPVYRSQVSEPHNVLSAVLSSGVYLIHTSTPSTGIVINKLLVK